MIKLKIPFESVFSPEEGLYINFVDIRQLKELRDVINRELENHERKRKNRLEFYDDGIYLDGEPLRIRRRHEEILRCFEVLDKVACIDLICRVWGRSDVPETTVASTISVLNSTYLDKGINIEKNANYYTITRP